MTPSGAMNDISFKNLMHAYKVVMIIVSDGYGLWAVEGKDLEISTTILVFSYDYDVFKVIRIHNPPPKKKNFSMPLHCKYKY